MNRNKNAVWLSPTNLLSVLFQEERRSGALLIFAAAAALVLANSAWSAVYFSFIENRLTLGAVTLDVQHWISEGLMAIFFLVVTLEVKRELIDGELRGWKKASFPLIAAIGGMLAPAFVYACFNRALPESSGWAIPIATDIAIVVGVLALLGRRLPKNLRVFLLALAIIDDIGSIVVIGVFYSQPTNTLALIGAIALSFLLVAFRSQKLWAVSYLVIGAALWYLLLLAGVSGTMAGVTLALAAPLTTSRRTRNASLQLSEKIEKLLLPVTAYAIVPLFVFSSTGLELGRLSWADNNGLIVFTGVFLGLFAGKPLGIFMASLLAVKLKLTVLPRGLTWLHIMGAGFIAGIGFTVSLLVADLSFGAFPHLERAAILGVFGASLLSGAVGLAILRSALNRQHATSRRGAKQ